MKNSVWQEVTLPKFNKFSGDKNTDVLIIGGGLAGLLCAYFLRLQNVDYILVEGDKIASGITKNTTAKITSLHGLIYQKIIKEYGFYKAQGYLKANQEALDEYVKLCKNIDCDFEIKDSYTYSLKDSFILQKEVEALNSLGAPAEYVKDLELPFKTCGAVLLKNQAQFNPLKFIAEISKDLNIYENTFINKIDKKVAFSDNGKIKFRKVIIATHFPFINKHGSYFLKLYQHRSYVSAFSNTDKVNGMYVDEDLKGLSFRQYNDLLLIGGGSHRTGKTGGTWKEINDFAKKYYPHAQLKYEWATQDTMSLDSIPYIGNYSASTPDMYVATGFNKWGMTTSMLSAKIICDMVLEKYNPYSNVFCPGRSILKPQLFTNIAESTVNLVNFSGKRCPHLGCALKWNKAEHSWDCPCHGSRFQKDGRLIDNPATGDADI